MALLRKSRAFYWLLRGWAGNWVKIRPLKQSHSAIRFNTDPVSSATSKCPVLLIALHTFAIVLLRRIWFRIKIFDLCSLFSLFSWPLCLIKGYFSKEKFICWSKLGLKGFYWKLVLYAKELSISMQWSLHSCKGFLVVVINELNIGRLQCLYWIIWNPIHLHNKVII